MMASWLVSASLAHSSGVSAFPNARFLASANAFRAFRVFSANFPSISPGENSALSSSIWTFTIAASILSSDGLGRNSALLIAAASRPAARGGPTNQHKKTAAANRRAIRQPPAQLSDDNEVRTHKFLLVVRRTPGRLLLRPLHRRLFAGPHRIADVMRGIDQRDMRQRLREISGLASRGGVEFFRQQAQIVCHLHH